MKHLLIYTLLISTTLPCFGQDYSNETKIFNCFVNAAAELEIDLIKEFSDFEEHLIKTGVLADYSGESYCNIYETIKKTGDFDFAFHYSLFDSIKTRNDTIEFGELETDCLKLAKMLRETKEFKRSQLFQLEAAMDSIKNNQSFKASEIATSILRILKPKDFEQDYYKMTTMLMLATTHYEDSGFLRKLPKNTENHEKEPVDKRNLLFVHVTTDNDSVFLNSRKVSILDLTDIVTDYIISDSKDTTMPVLMPKHIDLVGEGFESKLIISLNNDIGTSYKTYVKVQNKLTDAYKKARNVKALEFFSLEYDKLSTEQQSSIKEMVPMHISEPEQTQ